MFLSDCLQFVLLQISELSTKIIVDFRKESITGCEGYLDAGNPKTKQNTGTGV